jgi:NAD-dependent deacetylase sirtuin 5
MFNSNKCIGLSQRANHPPSQLNLLHGNLFDITCFNKACNYLETGNYSDPICPALAPDAANEPKVDPTDTTGASASSSLTAAMTSGTIPPSSLPHCPKCNSLLRPGVVWFGEPLPQGILEATDAFIDAGKVDLMLVIGTAAEVYPAAGYISQARSRGARVAVINMDGGDLGATGNLRKGDWLFQGDAGVILPKIFEPVIGSLKIEK